MSYKTKQIDFWEGDFGKDYTIRNKYSINEFDDFYIETWGISRSDINKEFLNNLDRDIKILEVGCNRGQQLRHLQNIGFTNLYGIELQSDAVEKSKQSTNNINIIQGNAFDIPFKDNWFDLVFTSGVLIHISPDDLKQAINEIYRCTKKYIWGFEYFSENLKEINYRGNSGFLWKQNFSDIFLKNFNNLKLLKEKRYKYLNDENIDQMYLLAKN